MDDQAVKDLATAIAADNSLDLLRFVGGGSFKKTYLCRSNAGEQYALKVFDPNKCSNERYAREIDAMRRCGNPHIAAVLETGTFETSHGHTVFLIEEYLSGGTLGQKLQQGPLTERELLDLGKQLVSGLAHLRGLRLVHRDIKPENIMFRDDGTTAVLVDLGLVRDLTSSSLTATWLAQGPGTPAFAAPEQLNNEKALIDWRADQFSMGIVLVLAGTGAHPFLRESETELGQAVPRMAARGAVARNLRATLSPEVADLLETMLAPWPVQRFTTPHALTGALNRVQERQA